MTSPLFITPGYWNDYELIDCGGSEKLERFGRYTIARPEPQALWPKSMSDEAWEKTADAYFRKDTRNDERGTWQKKAGMPEQWHIRYEKPGLPIAFRMGLTAFKHVGVFPEQAVNWEFISECVSKMSENKTPQILNLFAYTGGASVAARLAGAEVTHVDSVRQVVNWANENMESSGCDRIRWIVEDARKFVRREVRRSRLYDGIILDPPAYGRGSEGEKWILEQDIYPLLNDLRLLLNEGGFLILNLYSMGLSALLGRELLHQAFGEQNIEYGELFFSDRYKKSLPLGIFARFADFKKNENNKQL